MKIEKITENKIRIIINLDDLKEKNIDLHSFMANSIETQTLFLDMLKEAERKVGFSIKDSKILIEVLASSNGNFIFTITKVGSDKKNETVKKKNLKIIKKKALSNNIKNLIYKFETFDEFCTFCSYINNSKLKSVKGLAKSISLYLYNNTYYLVIANINPNYSNLNRFYAIISEFAVTVGNAETFQSKLVEYGKVVMKTNAINKCTKYFLNEL